MGLSQTRLETITRLSAQVQVLNLTKLLETPAQLRRCGEISTGTNLLRMIKNVCHRQEQLAVASCSHKSNCLNLGIVWNAFCTFICDVDDFWEHIY